MEMEMKIKFLFFFMNKIGMFVGVFDILKVCNF